MIYGTACPVKPSPGDGNMARRTPAPAIRTGTETGGKAPPAGGGDHGSGRRRPPEVRTRGPGAAGRVGPAGPAVVQPVGVIP